jgi:hypothetical protein
MLMLLSSKMQPLMKTKGKRRDQLARRLLLHDLGSFMFSDDATPSSDSFGWFESPKVYSGLGAVVVYGISLKTSPRVLAPPALSFGHCVRDGPGCSQS